MNIIRIFLESSLAAQIIMSVLSIFSIWSWSIFFKKLYDFARIKKLSKRFFDSYRFHRTVKEWDNLGNLLNDNPYGRILRSGIEGYRKLKKSLQRAVPVSAPEEGQSDAHASSLESLSDNIKLCMERTKIEEMKQLEASLPVLSTIVSVSPFLGLLGTVWGVMVAFLDIRTRGSAHITIVAPGISDALITTVYGLIVAIPALLFFNIFRSRVNNFESELTKFIHEIFIQLREKLLLNSEH
ncbi:MAG TPA: hypothetical protein ENI34_10170 [candidate division WOR-3 bacterium]|uniref:MotA/TolQ/ExbB proton channel domain-containing protein n=1 Tax=candidate division WOR-3 bacterium TaxID=2052148 RepID=A0A9C9EP21_UNCW3|nr:hypothetical protein [candidate division WOR-3 bacterium]